jgi:acyl carrier protein
MRSERIGRSRVDGSAMTEQIREILLTALNAARYGIPPDAVIAKAVTEGDRELTVERLGLDSLGWMEFCISIELQSGQELTQFEIEKMRYMFEIEDWLRERMA